QSSTRTAARSTSPAAQRSAPAKPQADIASRSPAPARQSQAGTGPWRIQLGAFRQPGAGQALFARLAPRLPGKQASFVPLGSLTRVLVGPYSSLADATAA